MTIVCRFLFFFNLFPLCVFFSGAPDFYPVFGGYRVAKSLVSVRCYVGNCLSFCSGHFSVWSVPNEVSDDPFRAFDFYLVFGGYCVAKSSVSMWCYVGNCLSFLFWPFLYLTSPLLSLNFHCIVTSFICLPWLPKGCHYYFYTVVFFFTCVRRYLICTYHLLYLYINEDRHQFSV